MQQLYDCLQNVIGLSDTSCDCWDSDKPIDFATLNESKSGLFISEPDTISVKLSNTSTDCEVGGVWDMLNKARSKGIKDVVNMFMELTQARLTQKKNGVNEFVGTDIKNSSFTPKADFQGFYLEPYYMKGGTWLIDKVQLALTGITVSTDIDVYVYSSLDLNTPLGSTTLTLTASNTFTEATFTTPISIDLGAIRDDLNERILFVYELPAGTKPVNNELEIGCSSCGGGHIRYKRNPYLHWTCQAVGFESDSIASLDSIRYTSSYARGLRVNCNFYCDWWSWLCEVATDFQSTSIIGNDNVNLGTALAATIQAASVASMYKSIIERTTLSKYALLQDDTNYYQKAGHWAKKTAQYVAFLVENIPTDSSDCLKCKDKGNIRVSKLY